MVGTVAERKIRCPSFELKEQMLFAEVAPVSVIKLNSFHLQGIEIKKLHLKAVILRPLHGFRCLFRRNVQTSNGEKFDGVSQILGCKAQETAVQTAGKGDREPLIRRNLSKHLFKSGQTRVVIQNFFLMRR